MSTLTLKKPSPGNFFIQDVGIFIPGSGQDTFSDNNLLRIIARSGDTRNAVLNGTLVVNNGVTDLSVTDGLSYLSSLWVLGAFGLDIDTLYPFLPVRAKRQWSIQQNAGLSTLANIGFATGPTTNGTPSSAHDSQGQWINYMTAGNANRDGGWQSSVFTQNRRDNSPIFLMRAKTGPAITDIQNSRMWFGLFSANPMASATPVAHLAAFRYDTGADGTAFWRCVTSDGAALTVTATTVAVAQDTVYEFMIAMTDPANIRFYINGILVATHTTNLPSLTQDLGHNEQIRTLIASSVNIKLKRIFMEHL